MFLFFFLLWLIFNGSITLEIVIFGIVIASVMFAFVCKFMDHSVKKELFYYKKSGSFLCYVVILIWEIIKANISVIHLIINNRESVEPVLVTFRTDLKTSTARMILANSITLTPGTITVSLDENQLVVHCLDKSLAEGMEDSIFVKMLEKMERIGG